MRKSISRLLRKYADNSVTRAEFKSLFAQFSAGSREEVKKELRRQNRKVRSKYPPSKKQSHSSDLMKDVRDELMKEIKKDEPLSPVFRTVSSDQGYAKKSYRWYKVAAVFAFLVATGAAIYYSTDSQVEMVTYNTIPGQKSTIPLPDGTSIRLNAGSTIVFPEKFSGSAREISLTGEAFFEVARDEKRPFIIKSGDLVTTVLGTSFNIKAFANDEIEVTVATGKVQVETSQGSVVKNDRGTSPRDVNSQILTPGQQATFNPTTKEITTQQVAIDQYTLWKDGVLVLDGQDFEQVGKTLQRWFGATIIFDNDQLKKCEIRGRFNDPKLEKVLDALKYIYSIEYQVKEDGIHILGNDNICG